ncbi:LysR family transcriptional regulator [Pseudoalteromonas spongiae]|uniref:LysR family transcriptional regulator n=1 Tax=Pseudoalteromonas spongiae TaxID=298657 RepID=UPI000C2D5464|nr:LysR family transcriptional regulator [Pseudoalteromonas spongiae]
MNLDDDYQYIVALYQSGTLSGAAKQLKVNHTTVARRIQAFEKRFKVRLFERVPKGYQLTETGKAVLPDITLLKEQQRNIERKLFGQDQLLSGEVNIALTPELANDFVVPALNEFNALYPNIQTNLLIGSMHKDLHAREADIALRFTPAPNQDDLIGRKLFASNWGVYASDDYLSTSRAQHRVLLWELEFEADWHNKYLPSSNVIARFDQLGPLVSATKNGLGIAKLPCGLVDSQPHSNLYRLDIPVKPSIWSLWLLYHSDLKTAAKVTATKDFLYQHLSQFAHYFSGEHSRYWK